MPDLADILKALIAIVVLINPLEGIPLFLARTSGMAPDARVTVVFKASVTVLVLLLAAMIGGKAMLCLFGIGIPSFTIAGGIIIFLIALKMVLEAPKPDEPSGGNSQGDIAIVPLGTPLLAGPGPISSVIVFSSKGIGSSGPLWISDIFLLAIIVAAAVVTYVSLRMALPVGRILGSTGINVLTRLAGILVAAIALQMILSGLLETFPGWK